MSSVFDLIDQIKAEVGDLDSLIGDAYILKALNIGQLKAAQMLHNDYLTNLVVETDVTGISGEEIAFSDLDYSVLRGDEGILSVKIGSVWANQIDPMDKKNLENSIYTGSSTNPKFYVEGNTIYIFAGGATTATVRYLKEPAALLRDLEIDAGTSSTQFTLSGNTALNTSTADFYEGAIIYSSEHSSYHIVTANTTSRVFTVSPAASSSFTAAKFISFISDPFNLIDNDNVNLGIRSDLEDIATEFAISKVFDAAREYDRANAAYSRATTIIDVLNSRVTNKKKLGFQGR